MSFNITPMRKSSLELTPDQFRTLGNLLVERLAEFLESLPGRPVNTGETPEGVRSALGERLLPQSGRDPGELLDEAASLLFEHSLLTAHPRHLAYIIGSPAPIGGLADLLAAMLDANVSSWWRSAMASEIEVQVIKWIAELVSYPSDCGGLLVSGGSMANYVGLLAARKAKSPWEVRSLGLVEGGCRPLRLYASDQTHAWIEKAADLFGLGTNSIRWIPSDSNQRILLKPLLATIQADRRNGDLPLMVVGNAGTTATGAIDPLAELAALCKEEGVWFHVDGAYGAFAAMLPHAPDGLSALKFADSLALDPHKWLYQPLEVGCILVQDANLLEETFTYHPPYYRFPVVEGEEPVNFYQLGPQNSRGFRALKVWLSLQQAGRSGYQQMLAEDIRLSQHLFQAVDAHPELEAFTNNLSITTFRYVPPDLHNSDLEDEAYLNQLNSDLLAKLQTGGEVYLSNALLGETFLLRACFVNFRTSEEDVDAIPGIVVRYGQEIDRALRIEKTNR